MESCLNCLRTLGNACLQDGTTAFERIFLAQGVHAKDGILAIAELLEGEPDFTMEEVTANVEGATREHLRLRQVLTDRGLWEEVLVDVVANHLRWVEEDAERVSLPCSRASSTSATEEGEALRKALASMPALEGAKGCMPLWQVLVTRRRLVIQVHHAIMDGVGLAMVGGSILMGLNKHACADLLLKTSSNGKGQAEGAQQRGKNGKHANGAKQRLSFGHGLVIHALACVAVMHKVAVTVHSFLWHCFAPLVGKLAGRHSTPISDARGESELEGVRYLHLGPFPLDVLKARAQAAGVTLNSLLLSSVAVGIRNYSASAGGPEALPLTVALPVSFKLAGDGRRLMIANNDFSTMLLPLPPAHEHGGEQLLSVRSWGVQGAVGAWASQALLSLLPPAAVRCFISNASRVVDFAFSNVNASRLGDTFVSKATGARKRVACHAYGALTGSLRTFILANSHGDDLHVGLTLDVSVVHDRLALAGALQAAILGQKVHKA